LILYKGIACNAPVKTLKRHHMKKQNLNLTLSALAAIFLFLLSIAASGAPKGKQEFYEIRVYHISQKAQETLIDNYLKDAYLPALHRAGISNIGVFKPVETDTAFGKRVYLFIPFKTVNQYLKLQGVLDKDQVYVRASADFIDAPYNSPPFSRYESMLLKAFAFMPKLKAPSHPTPPSERIYELRDYESATNSKAVKKIHMFNQGGEIALFERLGFNAVFYGEVLMGSKMPNLMYMITFPNQASRDEHWATFRNDPEWKRMSGLEEYRNTVSKVKYFFLHPTSYSDF